jgi:hypothetical protein
MKAHILQGIGLGTVATAGNLLGKNFRLEFLILLFVGFALVEYGYKLEYKK